MSKCRRKKECIYAMQDECGTDRKHCGYILITGEPRGCPVDRCDKFRKRNGEREKQKQTKTGKTAQATGNKEGQAVQPVGVQILQDDRGVQQ